MDPMPAPPQAPPSSAVAPPSAAQTGCPDSAQSSPRSRTTDSWDDHAAGGGGGGAGKLRLMCSYGGHIVPRPHDKSLCYVGGDTRIVVADRHSSLSELAARLSKTLIGGGAFTLKYQLPNEDLDSLISVTTDEDLENMIDEYDRTTSSSNKLSRLRLFLFPSGSDSASSIGSLLESSTKSEDWFLNALNGAGVFSRGVSESQSVNSLLGLDEDGSAAAAVPANANSKSRKQGQDVASVPDSPMLDTTSSFGSASSSPSMANLPPIRVHVVEDGSSGGGGGGMRLLDQKMGVEEQFSQMSLAPAMQKRDEGFAISSSPPPIPSSIMGAPAVPANSAAFSGEYQTRVISDDERSDQGMPAGYWKQPLPQIQPQLVQVQQKPNGGFELPSPDSVSSDSSFTNAMSRPKPTIYQDPVTGQLHSGTARVSADPNRPPLMQQVQDPNPPPGYVLAPQFDQNQHQQQQQFLHPGTHYIQHQPTGPVQISSYYPVYPSQQQPLYFLPARPSQGYNMSSLPQFNLSESAPAGAPQQPPNSTIVTPSAAYTQARVSAPPNPEMAGGMYHAAGGAGGKPLNQKYMGVPQIHHASQSIAPNSAAMANYAYEFPDPSHAQMYYSQALPPQYQTMATAPNAVSMEMASHMQGENMKQQVRTSSQP